MGEPEAIVKDEAFGGEGEVVEMLNPKAMGAENSAIDVFGVFIFIQFIDFGLNGLLKLPIDH